jgi:2-methylcitrate dehydratase PrpD
MVGTDTWKPDVLTGRLGARWMIEQIGLKPYPCCRHAHAVIDAALACATHLQVDATEIEEVSVAGPVWIHGAPFNNTAPTTMHAAQYSLGYVLAVALVGVEPGLAWFDRAVMARADVRGLAARVRAETRPSAVGRVQIRAGDRLASAEIAAPRGSPEVPMRQDEIAAKFGRLVAPTLDAARAEQLCRACLALDGVGDLRLVGELLPVVDASCQGAHQADEGCGGTGFVL